MQQHPHKLDEEDNGKEAEEDKTEGLQLEILILKVNLVRRKGAPDKADVWPLWAERPGDVEL